MAFTIRLNAIQYGMVLFLVASGLTLVFGILGVINLAHGAFYMLGAYLAYWIAAYTGSFWIAMIAGVVIAFAVGLVLENVFIRRLYGRDHLAQVPIEQKKGVVATSPVHAAKCR